MKSTLRKMMSGIALVSGVIVIMYITLAFIPQEPWEVPAKFKNMENPVKANDESIKMGAMLYKKHCASCHGKAGLGDGVKARGLETFPGDFSGAAYQDQTDGEHFYKTKFGRDEMPKYEGKVSDEDIWNMVNYMRTFKK